MADRCWAVFRIAFGSRGRPKRLSGEWTHEQAAHQCGLWTARETNPGYSYVVRDES